MSKRLEKYDFILGNVNFDFCDQERCLTSSTSSVTGKYVLRLMNNDLPHANVVPGGTTWTAHNSRTSTVSMNFFTRRLTANMSMKVKHSGVVWRLETGDTIYL